MRTTTGNYSVILSGSQSPVTTPEQTETESDLSDT